MRFSLASTSALEAICLCLSLVGATKINQRSPTRPPPSPDIQPRNDSGACPGGHSNLNITIQNNQDKPLFFYVTGRDPDANNNFIVLQRQDDCYSWFTKPAYTDSSTPYYFVNATDGSSQFHSEIQVNGSISFWLPSYASSARLYVAQNKLRFGTNAGSSSDGFVEPSSTNKDLPEYNVIWQFIEFTYGRGNFILNPSYVDFAAISLDLTVESAAATSPYRVPGLEADALDKICSELRNQTQRDNQSWAEMCLTDDDDHNLRAISPNQYLALHPDDTMANYYNEYVDKVWEKYTDQNLTINTQDNGSSEKVALGRNFICKVKPEDGLLWCGGEDVPSETYSFRKPTTSEVMGCVQGSQDQSAPDRSPFTVTGRNQSMIVPRLCAAFDRSTLLLEEGNIQPNSKITADEYYNETITNHYSRIIHERLVNHTGYAFAYDDTNPESDQDTTGNAAGVIQDPDPQLLLIVVR